MIAKTIRTCFPIAAAAVSDKAEEINKLNVFPACARGQFFLWNN